jgi:hypothetical protein
MAIFSLLEQLRRYSVERKIRKRKNVVLRSDVDFQIAECHFADIIENDCQPLTSPLYISDPPP